VELPNIKVKKRKGEVDPDGYKVMREVALRRMEENLIAEEAMNEAIKSSGGILTELIEDFSKAIELNPDLAEAYYNRSLTYAKLDQYGRAIEDYDKAIELNPTLAEAYANRGIAYSEIQRYEEATRDLKKAGILFLKKAGILFLHSERGEDAVKAFYIFYICFKLRDKIENDDIVYCGLALSLLTSDADVMNELRGMRIQDENLRTILELAMGKLRKEDISEEIAVLEEKEKREEMMLLLEMLKKF